MKVKGPTFEVKEYDFSDNPKGSMNQFKTRDKLFDKYIDKKEELMDESLNLYAKGRKM